MWFSDVETKAGVLRALRSVLRERAPTGSLERTGPSTSERSATWRRRQQREGRGPDGGCPLGETCSEPPLPSHVASDSAGRRTRLCSLTSELEAQLQRLNFSEEAERGAAAPCGEVKTRSSSLRRCPADVLDVLERDFSVQSMTSMINEDCFYDGVMVPTLQR